jgi:transcriptional regulator with XRE-family HTH domain
MDITEIRLKNLRRVRDERYGGSSAALAHAIKRSPSQIKQWLLGIRNPSEKSARHIEERLGLPYGWMDTPPGYQDHRRTPEGGVADAPDTIRIGQLPVATQNLVRDLVDGLVARQLTDSELELLTTIVNHMTSRRRSA